MRQKPELVNKIIYFENLVDKNQHLRHHWCMKVNGIARVRLLLRVRRAVIAYGSESRGPMTDTTGRPVATPTMRPVDGGSAVTTKNGVDGPVLSWLSPLCHPCLPITAWVQVINNGGLN